MVLNKINKKVTIEIPKSDSNLTLKGIELKIVDTLDASIVVFNQLVDIADFTLTGEYFSYTLEVELEANGKYHLIYRYALDDGSANGNIDLYQYSQWSIPANFYGNQDGLKFDGLYVLTPEISIKEKIGTLFGDYLLIEGSEFSMPILSGKHYATTWKITEVGSGKIIFHRVNDVNNLTSIKVKLDEIDTSKLYLIECSYLSNNNVESLTARTLYNRSLKIKDSIALKPILPFTSNQKLYYSLECNMLSAKYINVVIRQSGNGSDSKIKEYLNIPISDSFSLPPDGLSVGIGYNVYVYMTLSDGSVTSEEFAHSFVFRDNDYYNGVVTAYPGKFDMLEKLNLSKSVSVSYEMKNGTFLLGNPNDNTLSLYVKDNDYLRNTGLKLKLPDSADNGSPNFIALLLENGRIMINYNGSGTLEGSSVWALYELNLANNEYTLIAKSVFNDENLSCGYNGSATVVGNDVYYIPARSVRFASRDETREPKLTLSKSNKTIGLKVEELDDDLDCSTNFTIDIPGFDRTYLKVKIPKIFSDGEKAELKLRKISYDAVTQSLIKTDVSKIRDGVSSSLTICSNKDKLYILGGMSDSDSYISPDVMCYDITKASMSKIGSLTAITNFNKKDAISAFYRPDGKILVFNNTRLLEGFKDSSTLLIDVDAKEASKFVTKENNDVSVDVPFTSTVVLKNGGFLRLSGNDDATRHIAYYPPVALMQYDDYVVEASTNLVVKRNEELHLDDISKYISVIIEGDNENNTGKLYLKTASGEVLLNYKSKIVTRDLIVSEEEERSMDKSHLYLLPGVKYEVRNK